MHMVDKFKTEPPLAPKTNNRDGTTQQLATSELTPSYHDQFLEQLYRQYNIEVSHAILFYVQNQAEPQIFVGKEKVVLGRKDDNGRITPEFDLTPYDGGQHGVSRLHAKIAYKDDKYMIQDLGSTNGTRINGNKLVPYQYMPLSDGAVLQIGRLLMNVFIIKRD